MLRSLTIQDFALIDKLRLEFGPGLNVFTGETGAGKSIVLDALALMLGERASAEMIRADCEQAYVEALFETGEDRRLEACLSDHGLSADPDGLLVAREMTRSGKNRCFVNGRQTVLGCLKELGDLLVDIHGQHQHQRLLSTANHLEILDAFGDGAFRAFLEKTMGKIALLREARRRLEELERSEHERGKEEELLAAQLAELDAARLRAGEDEELEREWKLLSRSEEIRRSLAEMEESLAGEEGHQVLRMLARWRDELGEIAAADVKMEPASKNLTDAFYLLQEVRSAVEGYLIDFAARPERLSEIEDRLSEINRLKRLYGRSCQDVLSKRDSIAGRLREMGTQQQSREQWSRELSSLSKELAKDLPELTRRRKRLAEMLEKKVTGELADLAMRGAVFQVALSQDAVPGEGDLRLDGKGFKVHRAGLERAEFFVSTNPGEPLLPLVKIASGGELSRVTLALKSSLAILEAVPIMVFDEIDSGIGGETATNVAAKLLEVSRRCQCLCITHLPQIAARGATHFAVRKRPVKHRTVVAVERLEAAARTEEISRMLGGRSDVSLELAKEMLASS
ncbi:MAG: DNA repair protein RecN [Candidatus Wallbacteria bacterium]|nr:DNA repair protein RecN [Candidatus Wallbacteria bacterium]